MVHAGMLPPDLSNPNATRRAPILELVSPQVIDSDHSVSFCNNLYTHQSVNVFFQNIYLGAFTVENMEYKYLKYSEFKMEGDRMRSVIAQLNDA